MIMLMAVPWLFRRASVARVEPSVVSRRGADGGRIEEDEDESFRKGALVVDDL
jgi:hypothetical protein